MILYIFLPFYVARFLLSRIISLAGSVLECGLFETSKGGIRHTAYSHRLIDRFIWTMGPKVQFISIIYGTSQSRFREENSYWPTMITVKTIYSWLVVRSLNDFGFRFNLFMFFKLLYFVQNLSISTYQVVKLFHFNFG